LICYTFPRSIMVENISNANFRTREFTSIFAWSVGNQVLVVPPETYITFDEFLKDAKARTLTGAIPLRGGTSHLAGVLLADGLGIKVNWIAYEGSASSIAALARRDVDFAICRATSLPSWIRSGKISLLAVLPDKRRPRSPYFSDIPSLTELGYDITHITIRHVVQAPPNTSPQIVRVLEQAFSRAVREPGYLEWARKNYVVVDPLSAQELSKEISECYHKIETLKEMFTQ
jgi:tripartite-type tricarboxylate transporter receptor subunit TctC